MSARAPKAIVAILEETLSRLGSLTNDFDGRCSVSGVVERNGERSTVKAAVSPYVNSWIAPELRVALRWAKGEDVSAQELDEARRSCRQGYRYQLAPHSADVPKPDVRTAGAFTVYNDGGAWPAGCERCKGSGRHELRWHDKHCPFYSEGK